ncbi:MAG: hypothetical protein C0518_04285 [Opitutus sp.]|nr:hypothetical protein [Opitutus sp.]
MQRALGDHYVTLAEAAAEAQAFDQALHLYRAGISRSPENLAGRLGLAQLYVACRRPELARPILTDRLSQFLDDRDYLQKAFQFLLDYQFDADLAAACAELLERPLTPDTEKLVALYAANVAFQRGNYDRCESLLLQHRLENTPEGGLLFARADLERDFPTLALLRLKDLVQRGIALDTVYVLLGQVHRKLGQTREIELNATLRLANNPLSPFPRIDFLHLHHERGQADALAREIDSFLAFFGNDQAALLALGDFAANTGRADLARRIEELFRQRDWPADAPSLLAAEASLVAGHHADGLRSLESVRRFDPDAGKRFGAVLDGLQAVALFGLNRPDEARLHLEHLLTQPNLRAANLHVVATRLVALGHASHARALLERAVTLDPLNQAALTELVRVAAQQKHFRGLPAHVRRLMAMRKPSREVLIEVARAWGSDLNLLHPEQAALLAELRANAGISAAVGN